MVAMAARDLSLFPPWLHPIPPGRRGGYTALPPSKGAMAFQRAISQPSVRVKVEWTGRPWNVPVTTATWGPPYCWVHSLGGPGFGKKMSSPNRCTAARAAPGSGTVVPAAGSPSLATNRKRCSGAPGASRMLMVRSINAVRPATVPRVPRRAFPAGFPLRRRKHAGVRRRRPCPAAFQWEWQGSPRRQGHTGKPACPWS